MNVSSIVVKTKPEHMQEVMDRIKAVDLCEVHFFDPHGQIIVTIEGSSIDEQMERLKLIQGIPFVFTANLAYSYCEDELTKAVGQIKGSGAGPSPD
ncbi:MAG: nitrate reductase [Nitrospiraceae bacterium]|nr:MAG: nitrate reductase [Nitrospiraceae bacterium]